MNSTPAASQHLLPGTVRRPAPIGSTEYQHELRRALRLAERKGIRSHRQASSVAILDSNPFNQRRGRVRHCMLGAVRRPRPPELSKQQLNQLKPFLAYYFIGLDLHWGKVAQRVEDIYHIQVCPIQLGHKFVEWGWDKKGFYKLQRMQHKL